MRVGAPCRQRRGRWFWPLIPGICLLLVGVVGLVQPVRGRVAGRSFGLQGQWVLDDEGWVDPQWIRRSGPRADLHLIQGGPVVYLIWWSR